MGADTLVCLETELFGKPATLEAAYEMLDAPRPDPPCCDPHLPAASAGPPAHLRREHAVTFERWMRSSTALPDESEPLDKAGAYAIQEEEI